MTRVGRRTCSEGARVAGSYASVTGSGRRQLDELSKSHERIGSTGRTRADDRKICEIAGQQAVYPPSPPPAANAGVRATDSAGTSSLCGSGHASIIAARPLKRKTARAMLISPAGSS